MAVLRQVSKFNVYDPIALLAANPGADELLFQGVVRAESRANVQIIRHEAMKDQRT